MSMIITVGGIKGGSGKSTVATHLAILRSAQGRDVLLIDADDQETATDFTALRNERLTNGAGYTSIKLAGVAVRTETLRLVTKYDDVIIDTGGRDTTSQRAALAVAHVVLIPFIPRSFDVWTLEKVCSLVSEMRAANPELKAFAFINRADPQYRGQDNSEAAAIIGDNSALTFIDTPLGTRKAFSHAASLGLAVTELKPQDSKASAEIERLFDTVFGS